MREKFTRGHHNTTSEYELKPWQGLVVPVCHFV